LTGVDYLLGQRVVSLLDNLIACGSESPTMPYGETFLKYGAMTRSVHPMFGQREVLPDRAKA
jgi:hypothetical protein